ncbi:MAG: hypothetical protein E4H36_02725 [Spirochaetales bacterium]|nr:MAG: hypothetical protein E4H36_02725 [Spirochaetales bacterium]
MKKVTIIVSAISILSFVFLFSSCVSTGPASGPGKDQGKDASAKPAGPAPREKTVIPPDSSSPEAIMQNTMPYQNKPVFFGIATRLRDREEEQKLALEYAAGQASKFLRLWGKADFLKQKTNTGVGYLQSVETNFDESLIPSLVERLNVVTEYQDNRGTYVVAEFDETLPAPVNYSLKAGSGTPEWVNVPPTIPGYLVGVGVAQAKRTLADSITSADEKAFEEIIKQIAIEIKLLDEYQSVDRVGTSMDSTSLETAQGEIKGFYVVSRMVSPDGRYYYSLAVCPQQNFTD